MRGDGFDGLPRVTATADLDRSDTTLDWGVVPSGNADPAEPADEYSLALTWIEYSIAAFVALRRQMTNGLDAASLKIAPNATTGRGDEPTHVQVEAVVEFNLNWPPS